MTSLNQQLADLQKRVTQSDCGHAAQQIVHSIQNLALLAYTITTIPAVPGTPFLNGTVGGFSLMQTMVNATIGKIYSKIMMQLAQMLDVENIVGTLVDDILESGLTTGESILQNQIKDVQTQITNYNKTLTTLTTAINSIQTQIDTENAKPEPNETQIAIWEAEKAAKTAEKSNYSNIVIPNLKNVTLKNLEGQLNKIVTGALKDFDPVNIIKSQLDLERGISNSLLIKKK
jgi:hypothetical protein